MSAAFHTLGSPESRLVAHTVADLKPTVWQRALGWLRRVLGLKKVVASMTAPLEPFSFSGRDVTVQFIDCDGKSVRRADIQAISLYEYFRETENPVSGPMVCLIVDEDDIEQYAREPFDIVLEAANEYGRRSRKTVHNVVLGSSSEGVAIDDLLLEKVWHFTASSMTPWKRVR